MARSVYYLPEDWPLMKAGIVSAWLGAVVPPGRSAPLEVVWTDQDAPSPALPYASIGSIALAVEAGLAYHVHQLALVVEAVEPGGTYAIDVSSVVESAPVIEYVAGPEDLGPDIRDGLLAAVNAALGARTAFPIGDLGFGLDPTSLDVLIGDAIVSPNLGKRLVDVAKGDGYSTFQVDVYGSAEAGGTDAAVMTALALMRALDRPSVHAALSAAGWAHIWTSGERRLSTVRAGVFEHRVGFDVRLRSRLRTFEIVDWIETESIQGSAHV
jgi:hypothetical protein